MALARQLKKIAHAIMKRQKEGISDGDSCPRCGQATMSGTDDDNFFVDELGIYICNACGFDIELSSITGNCLDYEDWAMATVEPDSTVNQSIESQWDVTSKFCEGDRVVDIHSDWPGTVVHVFPQGNLYEVRLDGKQQDTYILKDREMVFEMTGNNLAEYVSLIKSRIKTKDSLLIEKITSLIGDAHTGMIGEVTEIHENGGITVQFQGSADIATIYPDVDRFQLLMPKTAGRKSS